jgi:hypothetical protein
LAKWNELMVCSSCGARASLTEWAAASGAMPMRGRGGEDPLQYVITPLLAFSMRWRRV